MESFQVFSSILTIVFSAFLCSSKNSMNFSLSFTFSSWIELNYSKFTHKWDTLYCNFGCLISSIVLSHRKVLCCVCRKIVVEALNEFKIKFDLTLLLVSLQFTVGWVEYNEMSLELIGEKIAHFLRHLLFARTNSQAEHIRLLIRLQSQ